MRTETIERIERTTTRPLTLPAAPLALLAELWWRVAEYPQDRAAKIQLALATKEGLDCCPSCRERLTLAGHQVTRTAFSVREVLACPGCQTQWLLSENHQA